MKTLVCVLNKEGALVEAFPGSEHCEISQSPIDSSSEPSVTSDYRAPAPRQSPGQVNEGSCQVTAGGGISVHFGSVKLS